MAISKRLRFEILRRDGHACRYCKATDVKLVIDHVVPESLGGTDDPENLVAACEPCNSGKSSASPDAQTVAQVADDALRWARAMQYAADEMMREQAERDADLDEFEAAWRAGRSFANLPDSWEDSVLRFRAAGLPMSVLLAALRKAHAARHVPGGAVFRYMCGIAWKSVTEIQNRARAALGEAPIDPDDKCDHGRVWEFCGTCQLWNGRYDIATDVIRNCREILPDVAESAKKRAAERDYSTMRDRDGPTLAASLAMLAAASEVAHARELARKAMERLPPEDAAVIEDTIAREPFIDPENPGDRARETLRLLLAMLGERE